MTGFESEEQDRPQFTGETTISPVTGKEMVFYPEEKRTKMQIISSVLCFLLLCSFCSYLNDSFAV